MIPLAAVGTIDPLHTHALTHTYTDSRKKVNDSGRRKKVPVRELAEQREDESQETGSVEGGNERRKETEGGASEKRVDRADALFLFLPTCEVTYNIPAFLKTNKKVIVCFATASWQSLIIDYHRA